MAHPLSNVRNWIFDLDNTLYPASNDLFALIDEKMGIFISDRLQCSREEAYRIQKQYFHNHGTTLAGLMRHEGVDPHEFLDFVHNIDLSRLAPAPQLKAEITALPGRKYIFTNADRSYAARVLQKLGLGGIFSGIHDIHACDYQPKPERFAYNTMIDAFAVDPGQSLFVEDMARNLAPAKTLGMATVWINNGSEWGDKDAHPDFIDYEIADLTEWLGEVNSALQQ